MVTAVNTTGSMISTLDASNLSYELESVRIKSPDLTEVSKVLAKVYIMYYLMRTVICLGLFICILKIINL